MITKRIFIIAILLCTSNLFAQSSNKFMGFIKIQDTVLITYKIEFTEDKGEISGFSLTDFGGEHETKSKIVGKYNKEKRLLSFKEVQLIYTKSPVSQQDFCNVHLESTKYKLGASKLFGDFKGRFNDGTECISGEIAMNSVEKINKRVDKFSKKIQKSKRVADSLKEKLRNNRLIDTLNLNVLKKNQTTSILTSSKGLKFFIYDGGRIDGDIITVKQDGKVILSKYKILDEKKLIEVSLSNKQKVELEIYSDSVGTIGSNTTIIEILDGNNTIKAMTNLKIGEATKIDIIKRN